MRPLQVVQPWAIVVEDVREFFRTGGSATPLLDC